MIQTIRERKSLQALGMMFPGAFWLILFFALPLLVIFAISFMSRDDLGNPVQPLTLENYQQMVDPLYLGLFWNSLLIALLTTVITLVISYPVALFIARASRRWRNILVFLVMIPFWTNFLVRTYALQFLMRANGPVNTLLLGLGLIEDPISMLSTPAAVLIGLVYGELPFMILPLYASLEKFDWSMFEAAQDLGANVFRAFTRVMLPMTIPGVLAGSILVFVPSVGSYITVELMGGGKINMIGRVIASQFGVASNWPFGSAISLLLMAVVTVAALIYFRVGRGERTI